MTTATSIGIAVTFIWLGMVIAISFIEAPLKFQAPGITIPLGLGIGRLVFRALNGVETVWAALLVAAAVLGSWPSTASYIALGVAVASLTCQLVAVRPALTRRSDAVLAGYEGRRSNAHFVYVGFEVLKVAALAWMGVALLTG